MLRDRNKKKFRKCILGGVICTTKLAFLWFFEKSQNRHICFTNFSIKIAPPEKTKYTMVYPTENATKLSIQIFDYQSCVTEIFRFKYGHFLDFSILRIFENWQTFNKKISVTKFWKSKFWIDSFVAFLVGYIVVYPIFSVGAVFIEKFALQNCLFCEFSKILKFPKMLG